MKTDLFQSCDHLTNSCEKKGSKKQRRKGKIYPFEYRVPKNSKENDVQAGFRKGRGTRDEIANICWIMEKAREFQKISLSALLTM